jgi:hypothetical protein
MKPLLVAGAELESVLWRYRIWSSYTTKRPKPKQKIIPFGIDLFDKIPEVKEGIPQVLQTY